MWNEHDVTSPLDFCHLNRCQASKSLALLMIMQFLLESKGNPQLYSTSVTYSSSIYVNLSRVISLMRLSVQFKQRTESIMEGKLKFSGLVPLALCR